MAKKIFDFLLCFKGFRFNKLEISISKATDLVTHPDINPVQQGLISVNKREPVFFLLVIAVLH